MSSFIAMLAEPASKAIILRLALMSLFLVFVGGHNTAEIDSITNFAGLKDCHIRGTNRWCTAPQKGASVRNILISSTQPVLPTKYPNRHTHACTLHCSAVSGDMITLAVIVESYDEDEYEPRPVEDGRLYLQNLVSRPMQITGSVEAKYQFPTATSSSPCRKIDRHYSMPLRIISIFLVLITSAFAVYLPILLARFTQESTSSLVFTAIKQFGTGVIVATALVHLLTHAMLNFSSECVGELPYESFPAVIALGGSYAAFFVEYLGQRFVLGRGERRGSETTREEAQEEEEVDRIVSKRATQSVPHGHHAIGANDGKLDVFVMELGIIFHSMLIGVTLVLADDKGFSTLLIVIIFHQIFEGLALGSRIASLDASCSSVRSKLLLAGLFAFITPIGMSIGLAARKSFNGDDRTTLLALGSLDAMSAGILVWVGVAEMWAGDWLYGEMVDSGPVKTAVGMGSLVLGTGAMAVLGKWT